MRGRTGSSWDKVAAKLQHDGYRVVTPPHLLSGGDNDAANLRAYLDTITGPIVLVGHSYGGMVITNASGRQAGQGPGVRRRVPPGHAPRRAVADLGGAGLGLRGRSVHRLRPGRDPRRRSGSCQPLREAVGLRQGVRRQDHSRQGRSRCWPPGSAPWPRTP
ncbi:alpha/beta fold hydrolase [Plantactinospora soyae]|uniref:alpha/beta fold hydrolase n=1 Tax=Plantactinospora soyae TaxID=1544732 RepID=UPI00384C8BE2